MILQTNFKLEEDGWILIRTISSKGMKVRKLGTDEVYDEAIDPAFMNREYEETDIPIENPVDPIEPGEESPSIEDYEAALARLGVTI